jgi:hypothetical protein
MQITRYWVVSASEGYYVTDGIWMSIRYDTRAAARHAMRRACWGERNE